MFNVVYPSELLYAYSQPPQPMLPRTCCIYYNIFYYACVYIAHSKSVKSLDFLGRSPRVEVNR